MTTEIPAPPSTFWSRLRYRFDNALSRGPSVVVGWLGFITVGIVVAVGLLVALARIQGVSGGKPVGIIEGIWQALSRVVDAGTFVGDTSWPARIIGLAVTICGIFIAGSLIGLIASAVDQQIEMLRKGRSAVLEQGHVLILGWSERVPAIVGELVIANESERRASVVVLAPEEKNVMEDTLREAIDDPKTTRIVCRSGDPAAPKDLIRANLAGSRAVIVVNGDDGDAGVVKAVLAVNTLDSGFEGRHLVAEIDDDELSTTLRTLMGERMVPVNSDRLIAELTAQACRQRGLSQVFRDLLDYDGDEIYFGAFPELANRTFGEARLAFEHCSPIGIQPANGRVILNPPGDTVLADGDELVAIARDDSEFKISSVPTVTVEGHRGAPGFSTQRNLLLVGWSRVGATVIRELDEFLSADASVTILIDPDLCDPDDVKQVVATATTPMTVETHAGGPEQILNRDLSEVEKAVVLGYRDSLETGDADARTLLTILALRHNKPAGLQIVAEVLEARSVPIAEASGADDFVVSGELTSLMMAQLSGRHELHDVFNDLFDAGGATVQIHRADRYELPAPASFHDVVEKLGDAGVSAIGYRISSSGEVVLNPPRSMSLSLSDDDELIVIGTA
ncbi:MAG: NAD-binding protein [Acidimicrobiales bacterium]